MLTFGPTRYQFTPTECVLPSFKEYLTLWNPSIRWPEDFSWELYTKEGKLTTRINKFIKKNKINTHPSFNDDLAYLSRQCIIKSKTYEFDISQEDWQDGEFGDEGSCYWGCRSPARKLIRDNGGGAIRFFREDEGYARAWIYPIDNGYAVFNGYGLEPCLIANILGLFLKLPITPIKLTNNGKRGDLIYINDQSFGLNLPNETYDLKIQHDYYICHDCDCFTNEEECLCH